MEEKFIMGNVATMSDPRESMKYKVGDEVWIAGELCVVSAARSTEWGGVYTIKSGRRVLMTGATETVMEALAKKETERKLKLFADELERTIKAQECTEEQASELRVHVEKIRAILAKASEAAQ